MSAKPSGEYVDSGWPLCDEVYLWVEGDVYLELSGVFAKGAYFGWSNPAGLERE